MSLSSAAELSYGPHLRVRQYRAGQILYKQPVENFPDLLLQALLDRVLTIIAKLRPDRCLNLDRRAPLDVRAIEARYGFEAPHHHAIIEIVVCLSGPFRMVLDDRVYLMQAEEALVLLPDQVHLDAHHRASAGYDNLWYCLREGFHTILHNRYEPARGEKPACYRRVGNVTVPSASGAAMSDSLCRDPLELDGLREILLYLTYRTVAFLRTQTLAARHPLVQETIETVRRDFAQPLSVARIADRLRVTPNYLSALFHRDAGIAFVAYLQQMRFSQAETLLQDQTVSLKEIAAACGFRSPAYFTRLFKRRYGLTPTDYRKHLQATFV